MVSAIKKGEKLGTDYFKGEVLEIAPDLVGKILVRCFDTGEIKRYRITETEAYRGEEDLACHASKGRTPRTEMMYHEGGKIYVYLIYGKFWLLNIVTGDIDYPAAVLIRRVEGIDGPGKIGTELKIDKSFYGEDLNTSSRIWIEDDGYKCNYNCSFRIGIDYASVEWSEKLWRFFKV
ncbi:MAG: DNA-3-methyladenine glycosylase [Prolixibacteraceae bacterium]|nr:DNA-3-methyladenine glycosylase [Prolixibacteraceae bacterium]